ncbi:tape measure protein [Propionibacterium acidifaciens]|uniref:tape measure protein n=1 Tax=Propionibacterium acidifaciens TaxID=556499 RepID=UPI003605DDF0
MALNLGTAWIQISPSMNGFRSAIEKELGSVNTSAAQKNISGGLSGAFSTVAKVGAAAMGAVAASAVGIGTAVAGLAAKGGIDRALNIENAQAKLTGLGHSADDVSTIMTSALAAVKGTAYGLGDAASVAAALSAAGVDSGQQMQTVLTTVADTAQISGKSLSDVGAIFSSVAARGKLQGDDLLQLTSAGVPVLQFLSSQLGVTSADVSDMVSKGQIDFATFASAMQAGLGGAAQAGGETFQGALANVQAALSRLGASVATPALDALKVLFTGLIPVIDQVTAALQPSMDALGPQLTAAAQAAAGSFGQLGQVLGQSLAAAMPAVSDALVQLIGLLPQIIGSVGQLLPDLIQAASQVLPTLVQAALALTPVVVQIIGLVAQILPDLAQMAADALPGIISAIMTLTPVIVSVVSAVVDFVSEHQNLLPVLAKVAAAVGAAVLAYKGFQIIKTVRSFVVTGVSAFSMLCQGMTASGAAATISATGYKVNSAAMKGATVASKAFAIGQKLVNAAMNANPIVKIVGLLILLGGALVLAYNKSETFRNIVNAAWNGIKDAASAVVNWFQTTVVPIFQAVWDGISAGAAAVGGFFSGVWNGIKDAASAVVNWFQTTVVPIFQGIWEGLKVAAAIFFTPMQLMWDGLVAVWQNVVAPALEWLWHNIFEPAWNGIKAAVEAVAGWFSGTLVPIFQGVWDAINGALWWLSDRFRDIWNWIRDGIVSPVVGWFQDHVVGAFNSVKDNVITAFNVMRDGIRNAWDAIKEIAAVPVRFVVNTVVAGIVGAYNEVASKFGADQADVPHVDFAGGGYTGPGARLQPAGVVHKGEVVWSQADVARWGGPGVVEAMRTWRGYDKGGFVGDAKHAIGGHDLGTMQDPSIADIIKNLVKGPVDFFKGLIGNLMDGLGSSSWVEVIKGVPRHVAEAIGEWVKKHLSDWFGGGSGSAAFDGWWETAVAIIPEMAPYKAIAAKVAEMESGFNPTIMNNWDSNAAAGHPSAGLMQFILPTFEAYKHPGFDNWLGAVDQLLAWWHYVNARYGGPMNIPGIVSMARGGGYVGYARGTSNARRGLAWVGENGPELIRFHGGEQVIPNDRLGSAGAGATYVFSPTYYDDGRSVRRDMEDWRHEMAGAFS